MTRPRLGLSATLAASLAACADPRPDVVLETAMGEVVIEVDTEKAPASAGDFLRYVDEGLYDGQAFYRTVTPATDPRDMGMSLVQGGRADLLPVGPYVPLETTGATGLSNTEGSVALARTLPAEGSAAFFFVNLGDNTFLDQGGTRNPDGFGYAVFGRVVDGMDTLRAIQFQATAPDPNGIFADDQKIAEPVEIVRAYRK